MDTKSSRLYDKRTVERSIKKGALSRKDYDKHLKSLEDVADKGVYGAGSDIDEPSHAEAAPPVDGVGAGSAPSAEPDDDES
jgi:hypothetical protein